MNTLNEKAGSPKQEALEVVIAELERNLAVLESNYRQAVSNLSSLRQCVDTDDLTHLLRRGAFMKKLHNLLSVSKETETEVALLMIDIDCFKKVNDTHGHQTGDVVLQRVSELIRGFLRPEDLAGRYGGEEIIVAIQANAGEAIDIAENIRRAVEHHEMTAASHKQFSVTLSVGIASAHQFKYEADRLIAEADRALYRAKESGRNKVVAADEMGPIQPQVETSLEAA